MSASERRKWANRVLSQLSARTDLSKDEFIFLAGMKYRENLLPRIAHYKIPLEGLKIGEQLHRLTELIEGVHE